ncbi:MAG: type I-E CRISPR-associated protein Cse1/CasA [Phycisphaerae bacterium]|nr:type I-E CRISPR-associated protein Cse1/CasA [Phycisphaerae bacterium]
MGIKSALVEARRILQIAASNPMDNVALLRFLLAVLLWCRPDLNEEDHRRLDGAAGVPEEWLVKLREHKALFNLLGDGARFYQDPDLKAAEGPATNLVHELPSGSSIAHFRHCSDERDGLCHACCAVALVRWSVLGSAGTAGAGQSMTACINGNTPAYGMRLANSLLDTLFQEWPQARGVHGDRPVWDGATEISPLGLLKGLTWRTRRILLRPASAPPDPSGGTGRCECCGLRGDRIVYRAVFRPGWRRPSSDPWTDDPHLLRIDGASNKKLIPSWSGPDKSLEEHAEVWRRTLEGVLSRTSDRGQSRMQVAVGAASVQALYKDVGAQSFTQLPHDEERRSSLQNRLRWLRQVMRDTTSARTDRWDEPPKGQRIVEVLRGRKAKGHGLRTALCTVGPELNRSLRSVFFSVVEAADELGWRCEVERVLRAGITSVVRASAAGSPLRRREAVMRAQFELERGVRSAAEPSSEAPDEKPAAQSKRPRKKKGGGA